MRKSNDDSHAAEESHAHADQASIFPKREFSTPGHEVGSEIGERIASSPSKGVALDTGTRAFMESRFATDLGGVRVHAGNEACAAKSDNLRVSQPNDPAELEADRMADQVMRMHATGNKREYLNASHEHSAANASSHIRDAVSSGGSPLDTNTRSFFEPRFGLDLDGVRVHTDSAAVRSASALDARAYTLGSDIVFGRSEYDPATESGKALLAHELAHVAQQDESPDVVRRKGVDEKVVPF